MRLRRLNLSRYGHFTDFILDFGERSATGLDFHIIFGDNEAGKSTAFNGYLDLLFGIEKNSKYNFVHPYNTLHIGAVLEIDHNTIELARIKRDKGSLIDTNGLAIDEGILSSALHGLSRESYQKMFSLNDDTIERGGEEILASKGDFGRLLFAGAAGLTDLSEELETLRERANNVYAAQSRSYEIASLRQELQQIDDERKSLDTQSSTYERLSREHQAAEKACKDARSKKKDLLDERGYLNAIKGGFAIWHELKKLEDELVPIKHLPDVPENWTKEIKELQQNLTVALTSKNNAQDNIDSCQGELENRTTDPTIIGAKEKIATIATLKVRAQTAREHLPEVRDNLLSTDFELEEIRKRLGAEEASDLTQFIISDDTITNLDGLLQQEARLAGRLCTAQQEVSDAKDALSQAQAEAQRTAFPDEKMKLVAALLDEYTENDLQLLLSQAEDAVDEINRNIELGLKSLVPWIGSRGDLDFQELPTSVQASRWSAKTSSFLDKLETQKRQRAQHEQNLAKHKSKVKTLSEQLGVITDVYAVSAREKRDNAWTIHRKNLSDKTATEFEQALASDDRIRDGRLAETERLAQLRIEQENLMMTEAVLKAVADEIKRIEDDFNGLQNEMHPIFIKVGLPENFQAEDLSKWLESVQQVRNLMEKEIGCLAKRDQAKCAYDQQRKNLLAALIGVGQRTLEELNFKELRAIARLYIREADESKTQHTIAKKAVSDAEEQAKKRNKALEAVSKEFESWLTNWKQALSGLWLEQKNVSQIRTLLELLRKLPPLVTGKKKLLKEISVREKDINEFDEAVCDLIDSIGEKKQGDLATQFSLLQERLETAQQAEAAHVAAKKNQERADNQLSKARSDVALTENRIKEMAAFFTTSEEPSTLDQLSLFVDRAKQKRELVKAISEKEDNLLQCLGIKNRNNAEEALKANILSDVETRLAMIDGDLEQAEQLLEQLIGENRDAQREIDAIGGDASVARLNEKRESLLLKISNKANRALALHLGLMAADRALAAYRDRHRSELLTQTADAFKAITCGEFLRLTTQPDRLEEKLIAMRTSGGSIAVGAMSKGTRFQLYLALRLAGYRRFCNMVQPLPFIGDDIMETFDDCRSESTIRQLSEIAKEGQVLYFTHHRHLCEIAKNVCGSNVKIHEIPKQLTNGTNSVFSLST